MLRVLISLAFLSAPIGAQTRPDSVELTRCHGRDCIKGKVPVIVVAEIQQAVREPLIRVTIRGDTAWAEVLRLQSVREGSMAGTLVRPRTIRVERSTGEWVARRNEPKG